MPISGVVQPDILVVDEELRLRKFDGNYDFAFDWYQDPETVKLVDGVDEPYDREKLDRMYRYLNEHGELYFIEIKDGDTYRPIGDVTFWQEDMPIVVGEKNLRGKKIGRRVVGALIKRAKELHYPQIFVDEIYHYNIGSQKCFESAGFVAYETTDKGKRYRKILSES